MRKISFRSLAFCIFLASFLIVLSTLVFADCCVNSNSKSCSFSTNVNSCNSAGGVFQADACSVIADCQVGCCCDDGQASTKIACANPQSFVLNSALHAGDSCSCGESFSISGTVYDSNGPIGGATVSVGDKSTTSATQGSFGVFTLDNLPSGSKIVTASKDGCVGTTTVSPFLSDKTGVEINLVCSCSPGCDISKNSYCDGEQKIHTYDITKPEEKSEYCAFCGQSDSVKCGVQPLCKPNDHYCPLGCNAGNDADCACNPTTPNGVCPSGCSGQSGSNKDIDCGLSFTPSCGDGKVFYPFETCEKNAEEGQLNLCSADSCNNCNCISSSTCGNGKIDSGETCEIGTFCSDGSACVGCVCGQTCSSSTKNPILNTPVYNKASKQLTVSWSLSNSCDSIVTYYELFFCEKNSITDCSNPDMFSSRTVEPKSQTYNFPSVNQNTKYFFYVQAQYNSNLGIGKSAVKSVQTGSDYCMNRPSDSLEQFCLDNKITTCDSNNNLKVVEDCASSDPNRAKFCIGPDVFNQVSCQETNPCLNCNGLYGLFAKYIELKIPIGGENYYCSYSSQNSARPLVPNCYFELNNGFTVGSYKTCDSVKSCYDFKSKDSCTDPRDPCDINSNCEWKSLGTSTSLGVCRPKSTNLQDCTLCDDPLTNSLSAKCTPQACQLFGEACQYQGAQNSPSCSSKAVRTCNNYDNKSACIGSGSNARAVAIDISFNATKGRIGGTHTITPSNDESSLGKCFWDSNENKCRRDADGLKPLVDSDGFDCVNNPACEADFENPVTSIKPLNFGIYSANPVIRYSVTDNLYAPNTIKTNFCVAKASQTCYPQEQGMIEAGEKVYKPNGLNVSGEYKLFFYSQDGAKNLEVVKSLTLQVDADVPFIEIISPRNDSQIGVSGTEVTVVGRSAPDVRVICAKNTVTGYTNCLNRCDVGGLVAGTPCITTSATNSDFSVVVKLNSNSANAGQLISNILIEATDFAGNSYSNTIGGIISDIVPPGKPTIIVR